jgi:uncharacterized damage-inducible protein DinB
MITPEYCQMMARYNAWQNHSLYHAAATLDDAAREAERGAFWGSIRKTLAHLMWGDQIWIARFDGGDGPSMGAMDAFEAYDWPTLWAERPKLDARIAGWAWMVAPEELTGDMTWYSGFFKTRHDPVEGTLRRAAFQPPDAPSRAGPCDADRGGGEAR